MTYNYDRKYLGAMPEKSFKPLFSPFVCWLGPSYIEWDGVHGTAVAFNILLVELSSCLLPPIPK